MAGLRWGLLHDLWEPDRQWVHFRARAVGDGTADPQEHRGRAGNVPGWHHPRLRFPGSGPGWLHRICLLRYQPRTRTRTSTRVKIYSDQENSLGMYEDLHLKNRRLHLVEVSKVVFPDHVSVETVQ